MEHTKEKIILSRISLLMKFPFFGNLATRLNIVEDNNIPTMSTDGRNIFYNKDFVEGLTKGELDFIVAHEVLHVCYDHLSRFENRDSQLANIAADYVVNRDLLEIGLGTMPSNALYDKKYTSEWSFEMVYQDLEKKKEEELKELMKKVLDVHMFNDGLSKGEKQKLEDEIKEAIISASQISAGKLPRSIERLIKDLTESKISWKDFLTSSITSAFNTDFTWSKPNRRSSVYDVILPGNKKDDKVELAVAIDASGSISENQLHEFLSEVVGVTKQFSGYQIHIWAFDTKVYNDTVYTEDDCESIEEYKVKGGGGTSFKVNWDFMKENDIFPKKLFVFTDGEYYDLPNVEDQNYCDTVFFVYNKKKINIPFGEVVNL